MASKKDNSLMGLGLAALGRPGYINLGHSEDIGADKSVKGMEAGAFIVLDAAWEAGIRYFDVARSYGQAEKFLAKWLATRAIDRKSVIVASKWGYRYTANWRVQAEDHEIKEHSLTQLQKQYQESYALLGDQLDLYQIHSATITSQVLENQAVLDELALHKTNGLQIGLTVSGAGQAGTIEQALEIKRDGKLLFDAVQATWNLLEQSAGKALQAAHEAGLRVIVKEALANGRLTERNHEPRFVENMQELQSLAREKGTGIDAIALAAAMIQPWANVTLSGAVQRKHLHSNLLALSTHLATTELDKIMGMQERAEDYWLKRSRLNWN